MTTIRIVTALFIWFNLSLPADISHAAGKPELLEPHHDNVIAARFSADGKRIVSLGHSGTLIEWDFSKQRIISSIKLREIGAGEPGAMSADGRYVLLSDISGRVTLHDLKKKTTATIPCTLLPGSADKLRFVTALAMNNDADTFILADNYNTLYRAEKGGEFIPVGKRYDAYSKRLQPECMAISPDGRLVAVSSGGQIRAFNTKSGEEVRYFAHRQEGVAHSINFSADGRYLTAGMPIRFSAGVAIGEFPVWEVASGKLVKSFDLQDGLPFYANFSRDGRYLFTSASQWCSIVELKSGRQIVRFKPYNVSTARDDMRESSDGRFLLIAGPNGLLKVYDYRQLLEGKTPQPLASLENRRTEVDTLAFAPDGQTLLVSHVKTTALQFFDLRTHALTRQLKIASSYDRLHFSGDGSRLFGVNKDEITIWRYPSLESVSSLKRRHTSGILYSVDGNRALAMDNKVRLNWKDWVTQVTEYDLLKGVEVKETTLANLDTGANVFHLLCADFDKQVAVFKLYSAFVYSLRDGSILREIKMPKAPEAVWLSTWENSWRFDCGAMEFVAYTPDKVRVAAEWQWEYASSLDGKTTARIDGMEDGYVAIYDEKGKEAHRFATIATAWHKGNRSRAVALSPDGKIVAVGTELGDVALYETKCGELIGRYIYFNDGEWAWIDSKGRLNGSEQGKARLDLAEE